MPIYQIPNWMRAFQIGFGILTIILSMLVLFNPVSGFLSLVWILGILLFVIGIEIIVSHVFTPHKSRVAWIALAAAVTVLTVIALAFPMITTIIVISLLGIALLFNGISRVTYGI